MRQFLLIFAISSLAAVGAGCSTSKKAPDPVIEENAVDTAELVAGNNRFALDLYGQLRQEPGNLFLSPYSISTCLGMTYAGAHGPTADEMAKVLHFRTDDQQLHPAFSALRKRIEDENAKGYRIDSANALWLDQGFVLEADFVATIGKYYAGQFRQVNFGAGDAARAAINDWVAKQTRDKIKEFIQPNVLDPLLTRLVLTNAIYFKGDWASRFPKEKTQEQLFYRKKDDTVKAPLMEQHGMFPYCEYDALQVVELPYVGKQLSMVVVLPRSVEGLDAVEKSLTQEKLAEWGRTLRPKNIKVFLPRFKTTLRLDLKEQLSALGMPLAFDPGKADFTGVSQEKLHISKVLHEAFVEVNEEGTEAAAATAVIMEKKSDAGPRGHFEPPTFRADHPFLFLIRDNRSGSILFIGRITDPTK